jgi:hypothetical protein
MNSVLSVIGAVLFDFHFIRGVLFVLHGRVIFSFTLRTAESDFDSRTDFFLRTHFLLQTIQLSWKRHRHLPFFRLL